jgi:glycosyltransferase involved in cell wall biosynthesis
MAPEVTVAVPSHERPLRLRWLLNALEEQDLEPDRWELVVVHDSRGEETERLLDTHPIAERVNVHRRRLEPGTGKPALQRNVAWRLGGAPLVAFTDDDCRPEPGWVRALLEAARREPGAIVQGATRPDPFELDVLMAPHSRTLEEADPPGLFGQTANILYPRDVLERLGGFDERFAQAGGEDTDLLWRALELDVPLVGAPAAVVNHAVEASSAWRVVRGMSKWEDLPYVAKRHPELRRTFPAGRFWRRSHPLLLVGLAGVLAAPRRPVAAALALPYLRQAVDRHAPRERSLVRALIELPGRAAVDAAEVATMARGAARHRTLFL